MGIFGKHSESDNTSGKSKQRKERREKNDREINRNIKKLNSETKHSTRDAGKGKKK